MSTRRFDEEIRAFLQLRLRLLTGVLSLVLWTLIVAFVVSMGRDRTLVAVVVEFATEFPNSILFYLGVVTSASWLLLRTRSLSDVWLTLVDGAVIEALIVMCLILYAREHSFAWSGFAFVVPFLVLFILARAVLIPSSALRTLILSAPAPLGVLAIQLSAGASFAFPGQPYPHSHFVDSWIQNQVCLLGALAVAATASRVNLSLRRRNFDARSVGQYDVHEQIGAGGMGEVYRATHSLLKRETALKFLRPEITGSDSLERFEQEVRLSSRLTHPNNIAIYDYGYTADGVFYYAMELLEGATIKEMVDSEGAVPEARAIHFLVQACAALAEAHDKGILHRDIKAANIMICERGGELDCVKILDFGLAKAVDTGEGVARADKEIAGSPETMPPEAIRGQDISIQSDLYSLSIVAYQLLAGKHPFPAATAREMLSSHLSVEPAPPPGGNQDLTELILSGLSKDPELRPSSARSFRDRLLALADATWSQDDARRFWASFERPVRGAVGASEISDSSSETLYKSGIDG